MSDSGPILGNGWKINYSGGPTQPSPDLQKVTELLKQTLPEPFVDRITPVGVVDPYGSPSYLTRNEAQELERHYSTYFGGQVSSPMSPFLSSNSTEITKTHPHAMKVASNNNLDVSLFDYIDDPDWIDDYAEILLKRREGRHRPWVAAWLLLTVIISAIFGIQKGLWPGVGVFIPFAFFVGVIVLGIYDAKYGITRGLDYY